MAPSHALHKGLRCRHAHSSHKDMIARTGQKKRESRSDPEYSFWSALHRWLAYDIYPVIDFVECLIANGRILVEARSVVDLFTVIVCSLSLIL